MAEAAHTPLDPAAVVATLLTADDRQRAGSLSAWVAKVGLDRFVALLKEQADHYWGRDAAVSLRLADAIVEVATGAGSSWHQALGTMARADAVRFLGQYEQSLPQYDEAARLFRAAGDEVGWARTRIGRVASCLYLGRPAEALANADAARVVFEERGEWLYAARVINNAAIVVSHQGDREGALALYGRALEAYSQLRAPPEREVAWTRNNQAVILTNLGRLDEAMAILVETQPVLVARGEVMWAALADVERARIHMLRGEYTQALSLFRETCPLLRRHGRAVETTTAENNMIRCLLRLNQPVEALAQADSTLASLEQSPGERSETQALRSLARAYLGDFAAALADLDDAEGLLQGLGLDPHLVAISLQRAEIYWAQGEIRRCFRAARRTARLCSRLQHLIYRWPAVLLAARALAALGRDGPVERLAAGYLAEDGATRLPWLTHTAHHLLGQIAERRGRVAVAAAHFSAAIEALEMVSSRLLMDLRGHYLTDKLAVYRDAVAVALASGDVVGAYRFAERARGRALVEHLANKVDIRLGARSEADQPLVDELTRLRRERARYGTLVDGHARGRQESNEPTSRAELAAAERELADHERRIADLWQQLQARHPAYAVPGGLAITVSDPPGEWLAPETLLIAYFEGRDGLLAFAADRDGLTVHRLAVTQAAIDRQLRLLRLNLDQAAATRPDDDAAWKRLHAHARALLGGLYRDLLAPLAERLAGRDRLIVVPHGNLHYLPFAALHDGERFLCQRVAVSTLPAGALLRAENASPTPDPSALVLAHSRGGSLPHVATEAASVAGLFPSRQALEEQATRSVLEEEGPRHAIIHLAAHAGYRADAPLFSSIFLADGPFDTVDAFNLRLDCSLVTLSACETGRSAVLAGDELIGLSRAFLYAGARSLVLTLWRVDDAATSRLMHAFYAALRGGATKAEALRRAQAAAADAGQHPFFWAAHVLVGDAGVL